MANNANERAEQARAAGKAFDEALANVRETGQEYVKNPTEANKQAYDAALDAAEVAKENSRRLHGGSE